MERSRCPVPPRSVPLPLQELSTTVSIRSGVPYRLDGVCVPDRLHTCFRKAEVLDLPFSNQVLHRSGHIFDGHVRVNAVLIEQIDGIDLQSLERALGNLLDVLWPTILAQLLPIGTKFEPEFGGDHHLPTEGSKRFAHQFFVCERAVRFSGVEEGDAPFDGFTYKSNHLLLVCRRAVGKAHAHAAESEGRDFQVVLSKCALLHYSCLLSLSERSECPSC